MKILKNILTVSAGLVLLTGCSDFLDSNPITTLVESNYYSTEKDAQTALIGCYDGLQSIYTGDDLPSLVGPSFHVRRMFCRRWHWGWRGQPHVG
ncbi:MAG: hypothetical protein QM800_00655 [Paludibacter sp.]